ncbi:MAG: hypothetical protein AB1649_20895 [Chloroflexota bacterium]
MVSKLKSLYQYRPAVGKSWLYVLAGLVWLGAGIMLIGFAARWLKLVSFPTSILLLLCGMALAAGIYFFGFSKLAGKNIRRICGMFEERICLFAFQEWKSYPLVLFMIALGIYLRIYSPVPKPLLAVLYLGIGGGLASSSLRYFIHVIQS